MTHTFDFSIIERIGITQTEFAALAGASRPTVCLWVNGHKQPMRSRRPWVSYVLAALKHRKQAGATFHHLKIATQRKKALATLLKELDAGFAQR